jgi:hypothetical protein
MFGGPVITTTSKGDLCGRTKDVDKLTNKHPPATMDGTTRQLIRDISSSYARANSASHENDDASELHHVLLATRNVLVLLHHRRDDLDETMANSYSLALIDSAVRIRDLISAVYT